MGKFLKLFAILLIVGINTYFLYSYITKSESDDKVTTNTMLETSQLLNSKNIIIAPDLIKTDIRMKNIMLNPTILSKDDLAVRILGKDYFKRTEDFFYKFNKSLIFSSDGFEYIENREKIPLNDEKKALKLVEEKFKEMSFSTDYLKCVDIYRENESYILNYVKEVDGISVLNSNLVVYVDNDGVWQIKGLNWYDYQIAVGEDIETLPVSQILIRFANGVTNGLYSFDGEQIHVRRIIFSYYLVNYGENIHTVIPSISLETDAGDASSEDKIYYTFNMINMEEVK